MKFYILCDIEGVASLTCWDEARSANACYAPMAREMALEAAAALTAPCSPEMPVSFGGSPTILWALPVFLTRAMTVC